MVFVMMMMVVEVIFTLAWVVIVVKHRIDEGCIRFLAVEASLIFVIGLVNVEVSHYFSTAEVLAFAIVSEAEVCKPDLLEGL